MNGVVCQKKGGLFMPFVVSAAEATLEPAAQQVSQSLANALARKWKENRGKVRSWIHTRLAFCIIRGSSNCLRSQKYSWNQAGLFIYGWGHTRPKKPIPVGPTAATPYFSISIFIFL